MAVPAAAISTGASCSHSCVRAAPTPDGWAALVTKMREFREEAGQVGHVLAVIAVVGDPSASRAALLHRAWLPAQLTTTRVIINWAIFL